MEKEKKSKEEKKGSIFAKKDFIIHQNEIHIEIKKGDDLSDIPDKFLENLKTEGVM